MPNREALSKIVVEVVQLVLRRTDILESDNFFDVGGRSLSALQVIQRINDCLNIRLSIRSLYGSLDLHQFVDEVTQCVSKRNVSARIPALPLLDRTRLPTSPTQSHIFESILRSPGTLQFNLPFQLKIVGALDPVRLQKAFNMTVQRHEALRVRFECSEEQLWQVPQSSPQFDLTPIRIDAFPYDVRDRILCDVIKCENEIPLSIFDKALVRANLIQTCRDEHILLISFHHISADGRSIRIFVDDLFRLYENAGRSDYQPEGSRLQYGDIVHWQSDQLQNGGFQCEKDYWLSVLAPPWLPNLLLGSDQHLPFFSRKPGRAHKTLSAAQTEALAASAKKAQVSLQSLYLAAIACWLARYGLKDIRIAVQIAGRAHVEFENVVGPLVTTVVVRVDAARASTSDDMLRAVDQGLLDAYEHADLASESLMQALFDHFGAPTNELCQVLFVMDDMYPDSFVSAGLTISRFQDDRTEFVQLEHTGSFALIFAAKWSGTRFVLQLTNAREDSPTQILNSVVETLLSFIK